MQKKKHRASKSEEPLLFAVGPRTVSRTPVKRAKLGRYESVKRQLEHAPDAFRVWVDISKPQTAKTQHGFIDLFCGAGGITCGLAAAGLKPKAAVEFVAIACDTHHKNFPSCALHRGPIEEFFANKVLSSRELREVALVVGGPPCQGFSVAGFRNPSDARNKLFEHFVRVVSEVRPPYFVMENVPGIVTLAQGKFFRAILDAFEAIGYRTSVAILEAAAYGVPQIRARAIFIGNRLGWKNPFPLEQFKQRDYVPIERALNGLPAWTPDPSISHEWTRHSKEMIRRISKVPPGGSLYPSFVDAWKRQYAGVPSMTIKENHGGGHIHPHLDRVLSAREMARLQSFPDTFEFAGPMKKAMWQIGNAVPPRLATAIAHALLPSLNALANRRADPNRKAPVNALVTL
jgi:DNA (cytosine-5)-methyltransferase 1